MSKHKKHQKIKTSEKFVQQPLISKRGKTVIFSGIAAVVIGFIILSFADPAGENFASHLAPFVIISGYVTIGIGLILPEKTIQPTSTETKLK